MPPALVDDDAVGQFVESSDEGAHTSAIQRHRLQLMFAGVEHQQFSHRRELPRSLEAPLTPENDGMASQIA